jgi:hypothetical protein
MAEFEFNNFYAADENAQKAELLISDKKSADLTLLQGQIKHRIGALDEAINYYSKAKDAFGEKNADYYGIPIYLAQCKFALDQKGILNKLVPFSANLNSTYDEYGAILSSDGLHLFFTARTPESTGNNKNFGDQRFFEDIVHYEWETEKNDWVLSSRAIEGINTEGFDALNFISRDGKYALGTINTALSKEKTTKRNEKRQEKKRYTQKYISDMSPTGDLFLLLLSFHFCVSFLFCFHILLFFFCSSCIIDSFLNLNSNSRLPAML